MVECSYLFWIAVVPDLLKFEIRLAAVYEIPLSTKFFLTFFQAISFKVIFNTRLLKIGAGVGALLYTGLDWLQIVQANLELSKSLLIPLS